MMDLPEGLVAYRRTPVFDQATLPAGLRKSHRTKAGVWALIHVLEGRLRYRLMEPASEQILSPGTLGVVRPQEPHEVEPLGEVQFYVEFYAAQPGAGSPHGEVQLKTAEKHNDDRRKRNDGGIA